MEHLVEQCRHIGVSYIHTGIMRYYTVIIAMYFLAVVESYELTGRHTVLAMSVSAGLTLVLLLSLVALYKGLAPIKTNNSKTVNATSKFTLEQESGQGKQIHVTFIGL